MSETPHADEKNPLLIFWEKPGCIGNLQQKKVLLQQGIQPEVRDLLAMRWTIESLRPFFKGKPVREWFNTTAPAVKSGEVKPEELDEHEALTLMVKQPILIRRPLLNYRNYYQSGFYQGPVLSQLGFSMEKPEQLQDCPRVAAKEPACEPAL